MQVTAVLEPAQSILGWKVVIPHRLAPLSLFQEEALELAYLLLRSPLPHLDFDQES